MMYQNREEAAIRLAEELKNFSLKNPLILAIPRGAAKMGLILSERLRGEFDVVLVHKFCPAWQPDLAYGAVTEDGQIYLNRVAKRLRLTELDVDSIARDEARVLNERRKMYTPYRRRIDPKGRQVVIVDDGIETGATMSAAVMVLREKGASRIVVAAPVASLESAALLEREATATCFLETPDEPVVIKRYYRDYPLVTDAEVVDVLESAQTQAQRKSGKPSERSY